MNIVLEYVVPFPILFPTRSSQGKLTNFLSSQNHVNLFACYLCYCSHASAYISQQQEKIKESSKIKSQLQERQRISTSV